MHLAALLCLGVGLPPLLWFGFDSAVLLQPQARNCVVIGALAAAVTWYSLERLKYFAKARRLSYVVPVSCFSFGIGFALLGVLRLPYSSTVALLIFLSVTAIAFAIAVATRKRGSEHWLVPGGNVSELFGRLDHRRLLTLDDLRALVASGQRGGVVIADLHQSLTPEWEALLAEAAINGIPVYHYRQILEMYSGQVRIDHMRENDLGSLIPNLGYTGLKRAADVAGTIVLLPLLLPLFAAVALLIKLDSPGPVFFAQTRMGFRGKPFRMYKFRSMRTRSRPSSRERALEDAVTREGDPRVTRVGAVIRRYRIDELPQILNILKGEMSWIGPRPEELGLSELYQQKIPFYRYRHIVRPGITGWAQVNQGHVAAVDEVNEKLRYDFYYVRNISLWLDVLIVLKTLRTIFEGFGAK